MSLLLLLAACTASDVAVGDDTGEGDTNGDTPTVGGPPIVINEFLASNDTILADNAEEFDDWIELYNAGDTIVQLDGLYLTDEKDVHTKFALPTGEGIAPGGFMLIWADNDGDTLADQTQGTDHANFKLNAAGDAIYLFYVQGSDEVRVDAIQFGAQQPDISGARVPDGSLDWAYGTPTPNASNG